MTSSMSEVSAYRSKAYDITTMSLETLVANVTAPPKPGFVKI